MSLEDVVGQHILRRLEPRDIPRVKALCKDCFPIQYSDHWFNYVTSQKVSLGFCYTKQRSYG